MIKVGTLCYLNGKSFPEYIGRVCTVIGPAVMRDCYDSARGRVFREVTHLVDIVGCIKATPPSHLIPIDGPDQTQDERHDERLTA